MVGVHYLKSAYNVSDEGVVEAFIENGYCLSGCCFAETERYFLGYGYFQHYFPFDPAILVRWRQRIGSEAMEMLLHELLETAQRMKFMKPSDMHRVTVDTTVKEKAVTFPTDGVIDTIFADPGYRGHHYEGDAQVHLAGKKRISRS